ncbi:MAG: cupin domain-containing protein [Acidimicrobiales bacterium]
MDVRTVDNVTPEVEHNGTVPVWYLVKPREMKPLTEGGFLELVNEFEVPVGGEVFPHSHPTHEFYYVISGSGTMVIGGEEQTVSPRDLVHIPPDALHSLKNTNVDEAILCFCFAVGVKDAAPINYTSH